MNQPIKFNVLSHAGDSQSYAAGELIFKKGDAGDCMYLVSSGEDEIVSEGKRVDSLTSGDLFGEMSLIDQQPRSDFAVARTDCQLVRIDEKRFLYMTENTPRFALQVMRLVAARLRKRMADLEQRASSLA